MDLLRCTLSFHLSEGFFESIFVQKYWDIVFFESVFSVNGLASATACVECWPQLHIRLGPLGLLCAVHAGKIYSTIRGCLARG